MAPSPSWFCAPALFGTATPPLPRLPLALALALLVLGSLVLAWRSREQIRGPEDFLVAGRRLGTGLSAATLVATWFGAGTLLTAADAVHREGLSAIALEPLGSGACLLLAGLTIAGPLWRSGALTLSDVMRDHYGRGAELISVVFVVPVFIGWIAVQYLALAGLLHAIFGLPVAVGVLGIAIVGAALAVLGGMWSVTLTDAAQLLLLFGTLIVVALGVLAQLAALAGHAGDLRAGLEHLASSLPPADLQWLPTAPAERLAWVSTFTVAAVGNLSGQDLGQRVLSARSPAVARNACLLAGAAYIVFGAVPVLLGLAARVLMPGAEGAVVPLIAAHVMTPLVASMLTLSLAAAVLSTIDSALLAPASLVARNLPSPARQAATDGITLVRHTRLAVGAIAALAVVTAFLGEDAYTLLEGSYALGLVALTAPLLAALWRVDARDPTRWGTRAVASMVLGGGAWIAHLLVGAEGFGGPALTAALGVPLPIELGAAALSCVPLAWPAWPAPAAGPALGRDGSRERPASG